MVCQIVLCHCYAMLYFVLQCLAVHRKTSQGNTMQINAVLWFVVCLVL